MLEVRPASLHSYWLMFVATVITVGIVTSSQLITERIGLLLDRQASELLAADMVLQSGREFGAAYGAEAERRGLRVSHSVSLRTAIFIDDDPRLVELKAVDASYPLRGRLERAAEITGVKSATDEIPERGEAWVDNKLAGLVGSSLQLGEADFAVEWLLTYEPDRGGAIFNLAPRVLMNLDDLPATGLVMPGSRVEYRMMFAGERQNLDAFKGWLETRLEPGEEIQDLETARPEMRRALDRTRKFFALAIVLTLVIAMAAIAITARYTARQEAPKVAMLRAFGISQASLFGYYLRQLGLLWIAATVAGALLGWAAQFALQWLLVGWFGKSLPAVFGWQAFTTAGLVGLIALAGFSLPYLANATATPPMEVLRATVSRRSWLRGAMISASALVAVFAVLMLLMQSSLLAVATLALILGCALVLPTILGSMVRLLLFSSRRRFWVRQYLLSRLQAISRGAIFVMSGFSLVLISILLIAVVKDEILGDWQQQLPDDIPNFFLVNIGSDHMDAVAEFLEQRDIEASRPYPLVRARLTQINSVDIGAIAFSHPRAESMVQHTFNVTYATELPDQNKIVAGEWIDAGDPSPQLSVEEGLAERLDLEVGDELTMSVGSVIRRAPVTSIRSVEWENFKPNFFIISNPETLADLPATGLLSALIRDHDKADLKRLLERYPSITLLDISELMARVRDIVDKASVALQFFFLFALASALIVLLAAIQTGRQEREIESALLRALSAQTGQLYRVHVLEFTLMGGLIGLFSAAFATAAGWAISVFFFDMEFHFSATVWIYSLLSACGVLTIAGTLVSRRVYNISPMKILRS